MEKEGESKYLQSARNAYKEESPIPQEEESSLTYYRREIQPLIEEGAKELLSHADFQELFSFADEIVANIQSQEDTILSKEVGVSSLFQWAGNSGSIEYATFLPLGSLKTLSAKNGINYLPINIKTKWQGAPSIGSGRIDFEINIFKAGVEYTRDCPDFSKADYMVKLIFGGEDMESKTEIVGNTHDIQLLARGVVQKRVLEEKKYKLYPDDRPTVSSYQYEGPASSR